MIILATARDTLRGACLPPLAAEGHAVAPVATWTGLCRALTDPVHTLILVDPALPGLDAELLGRLAASMPHKPTVRALETPTGPLLHTPPTPLALARLARRTGRSRPTSPQVRRAVRHLGLGDRAISTLTNLAASQVPVLLTGERGTGKKRVARLLHALSGRAGPFVVVDLDAAMVLPDGPPGLVYFASASTREALRADVRAARAAGWAVAGGQRDPRPPGGAAWLELSLPPLRERPDDIKALATELLEEHAQRLGLPRRGFDRALWAAVLAHRWPANARELDEFVAAAVSHVDRPTIGLKDLPAAVARRLEPHDDRVDGELASFEELATARLAAVVRAYTPGGTTTLWEIVTGATARPLLRLALARTEGNRKAAAELLGLARNTLATYVDRYKLSGAPQ